MSSERLNKSLKNSVKSAMLNYAFKTKIADAEALLDATIVEVLSTPKLLALPKFLIDDHWINVEEQVHITEYDGDRRINSHYTSLKTALPLQQNSSNHHEVVVYNDRRDAVSKAWYAVAYLETEKRELSSNLQSVLDSVSTMKQLLETLPASRDFIPEFSKPGMLVPIETIAKVSRYFVLSSA